MPPVLTQVNDAAREIVGDLEHRVGGKRRLRIAFGVVGLILIILVLRGIFVHRKTPAPPPLRNVEVAKVTTADVPLYLDEIGTTAAYETVEVKAQVSGQIIARNFQDGAEVKKGDLLFTIDPRPYEAGLHQAQAQAALDQATLKRQAELRARNVTAAQDWDTAQANAQKSAAASAASQVNLDFCYIKSPIDGRIGLRNVDVGNLVGPASESLVTIQGLDPIYTDFTVAEPDLPLVRRYLGNPKLKVLSDAEGDNIPPREGSLYFIDHAVQPGAGTVKARAVTPNPDRALWSGEFVHVRVILDVLEKAKLVPASAVQIGQRGPYVFVVKKDSTLDLRQVEPGQKQAGDLTVIKQGVEADETVVTSGQLQLAPGTKVIATERPKAAPDHSGANDANAVP